MLEFLVEFRNWTNVNSYTDFALTAVGLASAYAIYNGWKRSKDAHEFAVYTAMDDLDVLGRKRTWRAKLRGTAVIVGGSMTGLLAARVCADHFEKVVIIEADDGADTSFPASSDKIDAHGNKTFVTRRPRVPQMFEVHLYQPFGLLALRRLISNFDQKFKAAGGRIKPWIFNAWWSGVHLPYPNSTYLGGKGLPRHHNLPKQDLPDTLWISRANFEPFLRREISAASPSITTINGIVTSLASANPGRVDRVLYTTKGEKGIQEMDAALVVDCTGHSQSGVKWLEHLGYGRIPQESYDPAIRSVTVWFHLTPEQMGNLPIPGHLREYESFIFAWEDPSLGGRVLTACKGEGGVVTLGFGGFGMTAAEQPRTPEDLKEFYRTMRTFDGKPMNDWYCDLVDFLSKDGGWSRAHYEEYKLPTSVYTKYHESPNGLPTNFVSLGDAVMRTTHVYGLGVTKGWVGVVTLAGELHRVKDGILPRGFSECVMKSQRIRTSWVWDQTKEAEYAHESTLPVEGESLDLGAGTRELVKVFLGLVPKDEEARARFYYPRLWIYPNSTMLSERIGGMCMQSKS